MITGQRFPHKYVQRIRRGDKWVYVYAEPNKTFDAATKGAKSHLVVIAHGKPTQILVNDQSDIVFGPPNIVGKKMMLNTKEGKGYYAVARDPAGDAPPVYLYPESAVRSLAAKKAAKFVKASRALTLLNLHAEKLMDSGNDTDRDYGLAIWLNNNTQMRIGAHEDAASVDPKERSKIINVAKKERWGDKTKIKALEQARKQTFGLMSLRNGHVHLESGGSNNVTFRFLGKGGKENVYAARVTPKVYHLLFAKKFMEGRQDDAKIFGPEVNYKKIWRTYKKYGVTPHVSRGAFAEHLVRQLMLDFKVKDGESASAAEKRFNQLLSDNVSAHLNHTRSMTERSYLTETTRQAVTDFRNSMRQRVGGFREASYPDITDALGESVLWFDLGVGNTVI